MSWLNDNASGIQAITSAVGILASITVGGFTYIVANRAAKSTDESVKVAKAMLEIARDTQVQSEKRERKFYDAMRIHYKNKLIEKCRLIMNTMHTTVSRDVYNALHNQERFLLDIDIKELSQFFEVDEIVEINKAWKSWDGYLERNFFPGDETRMGLLVTNAPYAYEAFDSLQKKINSWN